jgi:4a-hydroxytetrahydrobiopterin dehydratase
MCPLSTEEAQARLGQLKGWRIEGGQLMKTFEFKHFRESLAFVNRVGSAAEEAGHHPDIDIRYNRVTLTLSTHDEGGLTAKDFALALKADHLL